MRTAKGTYRDRILDAALIAADARLPFKTGPIGTKVALATE